MADMQMLVTSWYGEWLHVLISGAWLHLPVIVLQDSLVGIGIDIRLVRLSFLKAVLPGK